MSKIEFEDLSSQTDKLIDADILSLANGLVQAAGRTGMTFDLSLKHSTVALFTAAEILLKVGEAAGKIPSDELQSVREAALSHAEKRIEDLKEAGIIKIIEYINNTDRVNDSE